MMVVFLFIFATDTKMTDRRNFVTHLKSDFIKNLKNSFLL